MRPLFGVRLVPSTPMNEDRLSTSGSLQNDSSQRLLPFRQRRERNVLRSIGNPQNDARILHREKSFGHDHVEKQRSTSVPTVTSRVVV